jgi:hypothetical protein
MCVIISVRKAQNISSINSRNPKYEHLYNGVERGPEHYFPSTHWAAPFHLPFAGDFVFPYSCKYNLSSMMYGCQVSPQLNRFLF